MPPIIDVTGQRYGRLVCLERVGSSRRRSLWRCQCDCHGPDSLCVVALNDMRSGSTSSCGCLRREAATAVLKRTVGVKPRVCRICRKPIDQTPGKPKVTCSDECQREAERRRRRARWAKMTPAERDRHSGRVCAAQKEKFAGERICRFCNKTFIGAPKRIFCSRACLENEIATGVYKQRHLAKKAAIELAQLKENLDERLDRTDKRPGHDANGQTPRRAGPRPDADGGDADEAGHGVGGT